MAATGMKTGTGKVTMMASTIKKTFLLAVIAVLALVTAGEGAHAYMDPKELPKLDMKVHMTKEEYLRASDMVEEKVEGDPTLNYRLRVPKNWIKMPVAKLGELQFTAEIFKTVVTYLSPPRLDPVSYTHLP